MDFWNSNIVATVTGAIVGGLIAIIAGNITYRRQQKDTKNKELQDNFKHKAEFSVNEYFNANSNDAKKMCVMLCPYTAKIDKNGFVVTTISKDYADKNKLSYDVIYLENIGESDVNELEIVTADPKNTALLNMNAAKDFIKMNYISYGVLLDRKIRKGEALELTIYYLKESPVNDVLSASLEIYYRDSLNNICAQPFFITERNTYEPRCIEYSEWREQVSVNKNLGHWKDRLIEQA